MPRRSFFMYPDNGDEADDFISLLDFNWNTLLGRCLIGSWDQLKKIPYIIWWLFTVIYSLFGYYIMWIALHYVAVHLYPTYCAPLTISGFILSPFMVAAPHCIAMRWLITEGANVIVTMWVAVGAYAIQHMLRRPHNIVV
uniref:Uncharacterized protein n=1 Tax=viral metagenome TaxID=1070528 RepID=A0A6C0EXX2_9ZZZZ